MKKSKMVRLQSIKLTLKGIKRKIKRAIQKVGKELGKKQQNNTRDEVTKIWFDQVSSKPDQMKYRLLHPLCDFAVWRSFEEGIIF